MGKHFTKKQRKEVADAMHGRLNKTDVETKEIADQFGISLQSVYKYHMEFYGKSVSLYPDEDKRKAIAVAMRNRKNKTKLETKAIAERYGVSPATAERYQRMYFGAKHTRTSRVSMETKKQAVSVCWSMPNEPKRRIAKRFGVSEVTLNTWVREFPELGPSPELFKNPPEPVKTKAQIADEILEQKFAALNIEDEWIDFVWHRKGIKNPMTKIAEKRQKMNILRLHEQGENVSDCISHAIIKGWDKVYPMSNTLLDKLNKEIAALKAENKRILELCKERAEADGKEFMELRGEGEEIHKVNVGLGDKLASAQRLIRLEKEISKSVAELNAKLKQRIVELVDENQELGDNYEKAHDLANARGMEVEEIHAELKEVMVERDRAHALFKSIRELSFKDRIKFIMSGSYGV